MLIHACRKSTWGQPTPAFPPAAGRPAHRRTPLPVPSPLKPTHVIAKHNLIELNQAAALGTADADITASAGPLVEIQVQADGIAGVWATLFRHCRPIWSVSWGRWFWLVAAGRCHR